MNNCIICNSIILKTNNSFTEKEKNWNYISLKNNYNPNKRHRYETFSSPYQPLPPQKSKLICEKCLLHIINGFNHLNIKNIKNNYIRINNMEFLQVEYKVSFYQKKNKEYKMVNLLSFDDLPLYIKRKDYEKYFPMKYKLSDFFKLK